jgi:hypothetical protein
MQVSKFLVRQLAAVAMLAVVPFSSALAGDVVLNFGKPDGMHAGITFSPDKTSDRAIVIQTMQVGQTGSHLFLSVDGVGKPIVTHIMTDKECQPGGKGCEFSIGGKSEAYGRIIGALRHGKTLHIGVETGHKMVMSMDAPLTGIGAALDKP